MNDDHDLIQEIVNDGIFHAELDEFLSRSLLNVGYGGITIRDLPKGKEIIVHSTKPSDLTGEKGKSIKELKMLVSKRFLLKSNELSIVVANIENKGLSAVSQCESLKYKLLNGIPVRRACNGTMRYIMGSGAKGVEVIVSGKIRGQRAKSMKFVDGFMIHSGQPAKDFVEKATKHVLLRQGVLGIKIKIMKETDPEGKKGPKCMLPDKIIVHEPTKEEILEPFKPYSICHVKASA